MRELGLLLLAGAICCADTPPPGGDFFNARIRPLLTANCWACHTASKMGGLQLDTRAHAIAGGQSGRVIIPGDPDDSLLIQAVSYSHARLKMPPAGKLSDAQIADLRTWIKDGAHWPDETPAPAAAGKRFTIRPEQRAFWSFQPLRPAADASIDGLISAALEKKGLKPVESADKRPLLRRATFDLIGLPPSPNEVQAFLSDSSPNAFARVVDRLLASPHFGERWGRHWLDVARYGEDDARGVVLEKYPNAWRYRDWIIDAYNQDMPYDVFVKAQIAGDLIEPKDEMRLKPGLGFFGLGPWYYDIAMPPLARANERNDRVDAVSRGFLGLTVACARCHDHKYDPISMQDYYALAGVFGSTDYHEYPLVPQAAVDRYNQDKKAVEKLEAELKEFEATASAQLAEILSHQVARYMMAAQGAKPDSSLDAKVLELWKKYLGETKRDHPFLRDWDKLTEVHASADDLQKAADAFQALLVDIVAEKKTIDAENKRILADRKRPTKIVFPNGFNGIHCGGCNLDGKSLDRDRFTMWSDLLGPPPVKNDSFHDRAGILIHTGEDLARFLGPLWNEHLKTLRANATAARRKLQPYPFVMALGEADEPADMRINLRGSPYNLGDPAPRRFLAVLSTGEPAPFRSGSGRLELAEAIVRQPLAARVIVNRLWQHLFGSGLVRSASNFGEYGDRPSHPELLDYLASRLVASGWSQKALIREMVLSAAYQRSSRKVQENEAVDPDNRLLWRANRRQLDAESMRDAILSVAGDLDSTVGGPSAELTAGNKRRTVYGTVSRFKVDDQLTLFDFPSPDITSERRESTIVPLQRLFFLNSALVLAEAEHLAARLEREFGSDDGARISGAYRLLYTREAAPEEIEMGKRFLGQTPSWSRYAQVLLASNEFTFLD